MRHANATSFDRNSGSVVESPPLSKVERGPVACVPPEGPSQNPVTSKDSRAVPGMESLYREIVS
jgi:hypothetical protein